MNVVGVGLDLGPEDPTRPPELHVLVQEQPPPNVQLPPALRIIENIDGFRIRVVETGPIVAFDEEERLEHDDVPTQAGRREPSIAAFAAAAGPRHRSPRSPCALNCEGGQPVPCGVSIGHQRVRAGTLGALVVDAADPAGPRFILSNRHVMSDPRVAHPTVGDKVYYPGPADQSAGRATPVASLVWGSPLTAQPPKHPHVADCAVAALLDPCPVQFIPEICGLGAIQGTTVARRWSPVRMHGRTTRPSSGEVRLVKARIRVQYPIGELYFRDQIVVRSSDDAQPFARSGDSGAIVVDVRKRAIGLVFATSNRGRGNRRGAFAYLNPINDVFSTLASGTGTQFQFA